MRSTQFEKKQIKLTLKILLAGLPAVGAIFGYGIGIVMGQLNGINNPNLHWTLLGVTLPVVIVLGLILRHYFKQLDKL